MKHRAFIALGSNLSDPIAQITQAFGELATIPESRVITKSSLYRTAPIGYDNQPDFINAVAEMETGLDAERLLQALHEIENIHGRERPFPNAPRVLDLDLLLYDALEMNSQHLRLPHPRMHERGFVLLPLDEIAPDLEIPKHGKVSTLSKQHSNQGVERLI